jgi:hypothetical protein
MQRRTGCFGCVIPCGVLALMGACFAAAAAAYAFSDTCWLSEVLSLTGGVGFMLTCEHGAAQMIPCDPNFHLPCVVGTV